MNKLALLLIINLITNIKSEEIQNSIINILENAQFGNITEKCSTQLSEYLSNWSFEEDSWSIKMLDATSKIPSGIISLNLHELGNFDQCIQIKTNQTVFGEILGKYCLGYISFNITNPEIRTISELLSLQNTFGSIPILGQISELSVTQGPTWAVCLPNGCSSFDVTTIIDYLFKQLLGNQVSIMFPENLCQTERDANMTLETSAIVAIAVLGFVVFILLVSTVYDFYCYRNKQEPKLILISFSAYTNCKKLFTISKPNPNQLSCLNGLRFLSIIWVVAAHQYSLLASGPITNLLDLKNWVDSLYSMFIVSGTLSVDTFFVVGGALLIYGFLTAQSKQISFNVPKFYLHRYLRLTPALAGMILVSATLIGYFGSGPRWPLFKLSFQENCVQNWWSTILYVQNYVNVTNMCVGQSWYLAIDTQLYLLSPLILLPLAKRPRLFLAIVGSCILASMGFSFYMAWINNLTAILSNYYGNSTDYNNKYYLLTHTRASAWLIGTVLGYFVFQIKQDRNRFKINKILVLITWFICFSILLTCILAGHGTLRGKNYDKWGNAVHIALIRPAWSLSISWIILACIFDYGGPINWVLSLPIFQVLNRFTYSIYLTHVTMLYLISFEKKSPDYFSDFNATYGFWGALFFSMGLSLPLILAFESPMIIIEKVLLGNLSNYKEKKDGSEDFKAGVSNSGFEKD